MEMHLFSHFLQFFLPILNEFNTLFQSDDSLVGHLISQMKRLLRRLMGKSLKTACITSTTSGNFTDVEFCDRSQQLDDSKRAICLGTREFLIQHEDELSPSAVEKLFRHVRSFYQKVVGKMIKKFPFHDKTFEILTFLNPSNRLQVAVGELAQRFLPKIPRSELEDEASDYILSPDEASDYIVSPDEASDYILSPDEASDYILSPDEASGYILSPDEASDYILSPDEVLPASIQDSSGISKSG